MWRKRGKSRSFIKGMTIWMVLLSLVPLLILGTIILFSIAHTTQNSVKTRISESLNSAQSLIDADVMTYEQKLAEFVRAASFQSFVADEQPSQQKQNEIRRSLFTFLANNSNNIAMSYVSIHNSVALSTATLPIAYNTQTAMNWGILRYAAGQTAMSIYPNYYRSEDGERINSLTLIYPVQNQSGSTQGYVFLDLSRAYIQSLITPIKGTSFGFVQYIMTTDSDFIIYNDSQIKSTLTFFNPNREDRFVNLTEPTTVKTSDFTIMMVHNRYGFNIYGLVPKVVFDDTMRPLMVVIALIVVLAVISSGLIGYLLSRKIAMPIRLLAKTMAELESSNLQVNLEVQRQDELGEIAFQFKQLLIRIDEYHQEDVLKRDLLRNAEIKALQSQIDPHFLYNTLDAIKWMAKLEGIDDVSNMVTELGVLLKASMDTKTIITSVREEMRFVQSYIFIQQQRYRDRFFFEINLEPEMLEYRIPKLILQPIVENALVHGIEPLVKKGIIDINGWLDDEFLYFSIADNGVGMSFNVDEFLDQNEFNSIGLNNVNQRIKLYYGPDYGLRFNSKPGEGTAVYIKVPKWLKGVE